jgi:isopenicillin-N epimerase
MRQDTSQHWTFDSSITYVDHGAFGACPLPVLKAQTLLRERMEREPSKFFTRDLEPLLDEARGALAAFLHAERADLVFVPNATSGVNAVLRSLHLEPDDELLTTNHAYNACRNALQYACERTGARVAVAQVPFPLRSASQVMESVLEAVTPRTRLALLDHVTSATALIFPVTELSVALGDRGIDVLIDGAHAPGMIPLDVPAIGASYYVGTCHKWICAPKGSAFLWVRHDKQSSIHPTSISHGFSPFRDDRSRFLLEFDWTGTDDPTPYLCVPDALRFLGQLLAGGWPQLMSSNHALAVEGRNQLLRALSADSPTPDENIGAMASIPIREARDEEYGDDLTTDPLHKALLAEYQIDVLVTAWPKWPKRLLRLSAQIYNDADDFRRLADALSKLQIGSGVNNDD